MINRLCTLRKLKRRRYSNRRLQPFLREGTDYGEQETDFKTKVQQVLDSLKTGEAVLVYSELHESVDIKRKEDILPEDDSQS